ncbi:MAG: hypothetical protein HYU84_14485 [Chloroflexi bacterium]|nr:hypothetical protein [Chloroflexota bacterium]
MPMLALMVTVMGTVILVVGSIVPMSGAIFFLNLMLIFVMYSRPLIRPTLTVCS